MRAKRAFMPAHYLRRTAHAKSMDEESKEKEKQGSKNDPGGSYTGRPLFPGIPEQDVDDL